ncbi:DNA alkylation repair protein [Cryobacterium roopkundense]|uniref:3-methyladenine DNA glycosylase AlkD n=1 Tax=Cryobacterium roopkundense TaxID=1001240 RepID=A0A099J2R9_9MICO|nr:DNA alkylation repair protein [Cryobacterium roopkundense]KGJ72694.1 DNA alkylation repair protein [Cryobacterium roopkundense]MBB5643030.1 3-methyladenine DNA glycosylase AlkD [Cryobacterium roopkundense]
MTDAALNSPLTASAVKDTLATLADPELALGVARFFQTGPGQYGEGDVFIGLKMPVVRTVVKTFAALPQREIDLLLDSEVHEQRLTGLLILVAQFERASKPAGFDAAARTRLATDYLAAVRRGRVNNWDLVDCSAPTLVGTYLFDRPRDVMLELAVSQVLWQRRVAMVGSLGLIMRGDASTSLELAARLLDDREPLMHKAVGWMLREVGKRIDRALLLAFLDEHAAEMPRTALSYATEHLSPEVRAAYRARR